MRRALPPVPLLRGARVERRLAGDLLHVLGLSLIAVAQPLFASLGEQATFFVAHRTTPAALVAWVAGVSLIPAAVLILAELLLAIPGERLRRPAHAVFMAGLALLAVLPVANWLLPSHALFGTALATAVALLFAVSYHRFRPVRLFATYIALGSLVLPLLFLTTSRASQLLVGSGHAVPIPQARNARPVVMVVFDELSLVSLLDDTGAIDAKRYPNFAALAATSDWYANAGAVADGTTHALPSLLTGRYPSEIQSVPIHATFPQNLFTLLANSHHLNIHETVTQLCPSQLCQPTDAVPASRATQQLLLDSFVVYLHIVAPAPLRNRLPTISQGWGSFLAAPTTPVPSMSPSAWVAAAGAATMDDRRALFRRFVESIPPVDRPALSFLHILLPHVPYLYMPSTHRYVPTQLRGLGGDGEQWVEGEWATREAQQRYLLQVGFVDTLIGELLAKLRRDGLFDDAVLIVTADHGVAFKAGASRRALSRENAGEIVPVPLLIKRPQQREGRVVLAPAELVDVLPTLADLLDVEVPWQVDGTSLLTAARRPLSSRRLFTWRGSTLTLPVQIDRDAALQRKLALFGTGREPRRLFSLGLYPALLGRRIADLAPRAAPVRVEIDQAVQLREVSPDREPLPTQLTGSLEISGNLQPPLDLAVGVNGTIVALTRSYQQGRRHLFAAMIPETALSAGANGVDILLVRRSPLGELELSAAQNASYVTLRLVKTPAGGESLAMAGEPAADLRPDALRGSMEFVRINPPHVTFIGWVADLDHRRPARQVALFVRDRLVRSITPADSRPDVAEYFKQDRILYSGFTFTVGLEQFQNADAQDIRVIALGEDRTASEVPFTPESRCNLARLSWQSARSHGKLRRLAVVAPPGSSAGGVPQSATIVGRLESVSQDVGCLRLIGWAVDNQRIAPPQRVLVAVGDQVILSGTTSIPRRDIVQHYRSEAVLYSGFELIVPREAFPGAWQDSLQVIATGTGTETARLTLDPPAAPK